MPNRGRKKTSATEAAQRTKPMKAPLANSDKSAEPDRTARPPSASEKVSPVKQPATEANTMSRTDSPRITHRDGVAYLDEYDIPIWQLEMGRRAGSRPASTIAAFLGLTAKGLELAFDYARKNRQEIDALIREYGPTDVPEEDEGDDEDDATFEAELDALFTEYAQVFRRLAE